MTEAQIIMLIFVTGTALCAFALLDAVDEMRIKFSIEKRRVARPDLAGSINSSALDIARLSLSERLLRQSQHVLDFVKMLREHDRRHAILAIVGGASIAIWAFFYWVFHSLALATCVSLIAATGVVLSTIRYFKAQRIARIMKDFPQAIDGLTRCLSAGFDINRSLSIVASEMNADLKIEFYHLLQNRDFGQSLGDAFRTMATRLESRDIAFLATLMSVQERSGGPMGRALESLSTILKDQERVRQKRMTASSEARMSALILDGLPIVVATVLFIFNDTYRDVLVGTESGRIFLMIAVALLTIGSFVMYRMIRIDDRSAS